MAELRVLEVLPQLAMTVAETKLVDCERARPPTSKPQSLPNLTDRQVHRGRSPLKAMTSAAEGRAKTQTTLSSVVCFKIMTMCSLFFRGHQTRRNVMQGRRRWGSWPLASTQRKFQAGAGSSVSMAEVQRADHTWLDWTSNRCV